MDIKRGDVVLVDLEPIKGSEQGKTRPCLIIQNNVGNKISPTTIVAAITSKSEKEYPFTVFVKKGKGGLPKNSFVLLNQIRTISKKDRIIKVLGFLDSKIMGKVDSAIKVSLGID